MRFLVTALSIVALTSIIYSATAEVPSRQAAQTTLYVDDDSCPGPGSGTEADPFCLIQDCIDAAMDGDECVVAPGTYFESINFLGEAITLRSSDGADVTTIDGNAAVRVLEVTGASTNLTLTGVTLKVYG